MSGRTHAIRIATAGLSLATLLFTACERRPDSGQTPDSSPGASSSPAAAAPTEFVVPQLSAAELAALGTALEMKVTSAYSVACEDPQDAGKLATLAAVYYVQGHTEPAVALFRRVSELKPQDFNSWFYFGTACEKVGRTAEARSAYERARELGPLYGPLSRRLGDVLASTDPARAIEHYQQALDMNPSDVPAWGGLGRVQIASGQREAGLRSILIAANLEPGYADAQRAAAQALRAAGRDSEAEQYARAAEAGGPAQPAEDPLQDSLLRAGYDARAVCAEALRIVEYGNAEGAKFLLGQLLPMRGGKVPATEALGVVAAAQDKWEEAGKYFSEVLAADAQAYAARSSMGEVLIQQGKLAEAEQCLREVLMQHTEHAATVRRFAGLMSKLNKPRETLAALEAAVAARPFDPVRRGLLAQHYAAAGRRDDAQGELRKALELRPDYFPARQQLGLLLCGQRKYPEARAEFEGALQSNPRFEDGYLYLSTTLIQANKDMRGAERILREGLKNVPHSHVLANSLAWVLATAPEAAQRNGGEAVQLAERANTTTGHTRHNYLDTLGAAYAEAGRYEEAKRVVRQAIEAGGRVNAPEVERYRQRLALYEQNRPFHEPG